MSTKLSQSSAWIIASLISMALFGILIAWIMSIPVAHERGSQSFEMDSRVISDSYEIQAEDHNEMQQSYEQDSQTIRSDEPEYLNETPEQNAIDPESRSEKQATKQTFSLAAKAPLDAKKKI